MRKLQIDLKPVQLAERHRFGSPSQVASVPTHSHGSYP